MTSLERGCDLVGRHWLAKRRTLHQVVAHGVDRLELFARFDSLDDDVESLALTDVHDVLEELGGFLAVRERLDKLLADLDLLYREVGQTPQR